ncbi:transcription termination/antitermination protein NusG [Rhodoplanes sp. SY1]|uniref:transcription termination/antitermination protein NusG n=1 Tax=Rhodoplanes sp. SY1 TaxID=3166646 RepID=UPI0038B6885D
MLRLTDDDDLVWGCVQTVGGREALCASEIVRAGLSAYWPRFTVARRSNHTSGTREVRRSLFPGYVFAGWPAARPQAWRIIRTVPGQRRVLEAAYDRPAVIDRAFLAALVGHEYELAHNLGAARKAFGIAPGDPVRLVTGPFAGLWARLVSLDDTGRIAVLLDILGGPTLVKGLTTDQVSPT